jgi:Zn finger protein HypA/HybF involved in hydrogenase expression
MEWRCKYCGKTFDKGLKLNGHISFGHINKRRHLEKVEIEKNCPKCGKIFKVLRNIKNGIIYPIKDERKYCSRTCANSKNWSKEHKDKLSKTIREKFGTSKYETHCLGCNKKISSKTKSGFCKKCYSKSRIGKRMFFRTKHENEELDHYRLDCRFRFNLSSFPEEFDFELYKKYGKYKAANRGNNLKGISRDHMFSIMDGYKNKIAPEIIRHPANCNLMVHNENSSKHDSSSITLIELYERISNWNKKYGSVL